MELAFIHGAADSGAVWERQLQYFAGSHKALALDLPGHGARLAEQAYESADQNAEEVARLIRARGLRRPVLVGHSMGGAIALYLALREPALALALVLVGTGARLRMRSDLLENARLRADVAPTSRAIPRLIALDDVVSFSASPEARAWLAARFGQATGQATYADFLATHRFDVMDRLAEVPQPTLVVGGEDDRWTPPRFHQFLAERLPNARLVLLPGTGHYPFVEQADLFNRELERFLAEVKGEPGD